ncbi:preprotein translocase SecA subunit-like protein [Scophthalmus maximus]|uniref:Preprotein translocase SecA subunit-like protein n=1 Tax=Scophthalmus maximus TaxID=52904 RepID=A0A2U9AZU5_SCOMX|nr:protein translocase subunit SecA-like [Scophthalmus maximus]AWO97194.1 preprotein translocase SecA subunit-like protein [Scophthalmus maximus]KAF0028869.1 hypothetical protein F2P81_017974 [Scophthalmus maximus]
MDDCDVDRVEGLVLRFFTVSSHSNTLLSVDDEELLLNKLQGLVTNIHWTSAAAVDLFETLLNRFESTTKDRSQLMVWMLEMLHCVQIHLITPSWRSGPGDGGKTLMELVRDESVPDPHLKKSLANDTEKQLDEILEEIRQEKLNQIDEELLAEMRDIVSSVDEDLTSRREGSHRGGLKKDLLRLCKAAELAQFRPRLTQMVSWCLMVLSTAGRLIQVGTGEGKSCIVAMFAAFRALRGEKVDIMSSSSVLAERDSDDWRRFYSILKISISCNTNKQGIDLKRCYECQVVYGTVEDFAGDWLKHHFHKTDIFGQRKFECAIVDEVDSLMLDRGLHVVYLSSDMPAFQHLNPLLAFIWATANQYSKVGTETVVGRKYPFHQVVLKNATTSQDVDEFTVLQMAEDAGVLAKGSVRELRRDLSLLTEKMTDVTATQLAGFFQTAERKFPSCSFALHCINNDGAIEELNKELQREDGERQRVPLLVINGGFCRYMYPDKDSVRRASEEEVRCALHFTPCDVSKDKSSCYVPGFLSDLVESKLKVWIGNAFYAQTMTEDHEYIMEDHGIVPVDYSVTGVVENFMKWADGLQQFLEMKHASKVSDMTVVTNYMSNVSMLQQYKNQIYGISGTLGQQAETETLQKIYKGIKTCQIPAFKRRKLFEVAGRLIPGEKEWIEKICNVVTAEINPTPYRPGRAVLIICETINRAKVLHDSLGDEVHHKKLYINNNMDNTAIFAKDLEAGEVIIATNLAGRGTDLQVSEEVKTAGGLLVVQTFLPKNARVEAQAFGRTARQGSPGSAQLIVCSGHLTEPFPLLIALKMKLSFLMSESPRSEIETAKLLRDDLVAQTLDRYLEQHIPFIKKKEQLFFQYLATLDGVYKTSNNKPAASHLSALNEFWGIWLLTRFKADESDAELKSRLSEDLDRAKQQLELRESPSSDLHYYTAFGNEQRKKGHLAESIGMYTKAIEEDYCWAAIAYYNRAFASLTLHGRHQDLICINQALEDLQNALRSVDLHCEQAEVTLSHSTQQINEARTDSVTRLDVHITARHTVLLCFKANINDAIEKINGARDTGASVRVDESLVYVLLLPELLLSLTVLSRDSLRHRDPVEIHRLINHPSFMVDIFNQLLCLKSLGLTHVYTVDRVFSLRGFLAKMNTTICHAHE